MTDQLEEMIRERFSQRAASVTNEPALDEVATRISRRRQRRVAVAAGTCIVLIGVGVAGAQAITPKPQGKDVAADAPTRAGWTTHTARGIAFDAPTSWTAITYRCGTGDDRPIVILPTGTPAQHDCKSGESPSKEIAVLYHVKYEFDSPGPLLSKESREIAGVPTVQENYRLTDGRYDSYLTFRLNASEWVLSVRTPNQETLKLIMSSVRLSDN